MIESLQWPACDINPDIPSIVVGTNSEPRCLTATQRRLCVPHRHIKGPVMCHRPVMHDVSHLPSFEVSLQPFVVPFNNPQKVMAPTLGRGCAKQQVECAKTIRRRYCGHLTSSWHPPSVEDVQKKTSGMHENDQATIKTRYCGHLYSPLLRKWTSWDQRGWVSYCMEGGLKGT